jgi:putative heme transporter
VDPLAVAKAGYVAVPVAVALETVGLPVPAETTLVAAAVLAARGDLDITLVIALAAVAAIVGDNAGYLLGKRLGRRILLAPGPLARSRRRLVEGGDRFFAAHGAMTVFLGRWVAVGRMATAWLAGADEMPWRRFAAWNALGGVAWATTVGLTAYALGAAGARWLAVAGTLAALVTLARLGGVRARPVRAAAGRAARPVRAAAGRAVHALGTAARRHVLLVLTLGAAATGFVVFVLPEVAGAGDEWRRVRDGDLAWLSVAAAAEVASYAGYVALLRAVFAREVGWRDSFLITMAGVAATRLLATAGAGGIALTSWALHRLGLPARRVARGLVAFLVTLYAVYLAALVVLGVGFGTGILNGGGAAVLTLLPAALAAAVIALALVAGHDPGRIEAGLAALAARGGRLRRPVAWLASTLADGGEGIALALALARRRPAVLLAAVAWWGFDIAALAAAFEAFGSPPAAPVLVLCYLLGMLGNLLPLPGGVGGVEGGMLAAFVAFGQPAGPALVAVLAYRLASFWLPTVIGAPAYLALRRSLGRRER